MAFDDLSDTIRAALGRSDGARWFELSGDAAAGVVGTPGVGRDQGPSFRAVKVRAHLVVHAQGTALLTFTFRWEADGGVLDLDGVVEAVFLARVADPDWRTGGGWSLQPSDPSVAKHLQGGRIGLNRLAQLLVPDETGLRLARRHAVVHTAVVLEANTEPVGAVDAAWWMRRGYDRTYSPPTGNTGEDVVLRPRGNRLVGVSRDGAVAISWVGPETGGFERATWPRRFTSTYLLLHLHVLSERAALGALATEVQGRVGAISAAPDAPNARAARDELTRSVERLVQYSVAVSTEECGGLADQEEFYRALRQVHGIREQRAELRAEVQEVFGLVEARWREAEERDRRAGEERARLADAQAAAVHALEQARASRLERLVGWVGAPALMVSTCSGLLGMNIASGADPQLWTFPAFWAVVGLALTLAFAMMLAMWWVFRPRRAERDRLERSMAHLPGASPEGP